MARRDIAGLLDRLAGRAGIDLTQPRRTAQVVAWCKEFAAYSPEAVDRAEAALRRLDRDWPSAGQLRDALATAQTTINIAARQARNNEPERLDPKLSVIRDFNSLCDAAARMFVAVRDRFGWGAADVLYRDEMRKLRQGIKCNAEIIAEQGDDALTALLDGFVAEG